MQEHWVGKKAKKLLFGKVKGKKDEIGRRADTGDVVIKIDPRYFRPSEVDELLGDASKAYKKLGWEPKISLEGMIEEMVKKDKEESLKESLLKSKGFEVITSMETPPN